MTYLILTGIAILIVFSVWYSKKIDENPDHPYNTSTRTTRVTTETAADSPISFGYKCMWIAIKTEDMQGVAEIIGMKDIVESNWKNGIQKAYSNSIFITPAIDNWTLAVGWGLPRGDSKESLEQIKKILIDLSRTFGEAQFFCTHRVIEYHSWIKSTRGSIKRVYSYHGEIGKNIEISGNPTKIELDYNLVNTFSKEVQKDENYELEDLTYPDEELVMTIAGEWSIDPSSLDNKKKYEGLGLLGIRK